MIRTKIFIIMVFLFSSVGGTASACMNDSECTGSKVCECTTHDPKTGNCSTAGICESRLSDKLSDDVESFIDEFLRDAQSKRDEKALFGCHTKCEVRDGGLHCKIDC